MICVSVESLSPQPIFSVWLIARHQRHRLLGPEGMNPCQVVSHWRSVGQELGLPVLLHERVEAAVQDSIAGRFDYPTVKDLMGEITQPSQRLPGSLWTPRPA